MPPHPQPWPLDKRYDKQLLAAGDKRNVADKYRYWTIEAIRDDLRESSAGCEIAIENLERDFNMGTIVRNANAFNVKTLHIIGRRQWNKRGAMMTDVYLQLEYHATVADFLQATAGKSYVAVDNTEGAVALHDVALPRSAILVFGSEGQGISDDLLGKCTLHVEIEQFGSTRSINVGVASGILMYKWAEQHILSTT
ncbi:MAG: RNA methyltransferase, TrmH family [Candidatus Saccharibacteria bacterium GW2011_GWC2_48_9]|nr:MAG: RNA methyltransferase, TrmH family [Candidatus Saccharibacteria bacterium GW2011_GWC2_48_9]